MKLLIATAFILATSICGAASVQTNPDQKNLAPCRTSADCKGAVPRFCVVCPSGKTGGCAHWSCVENVCKIRTCDIDSK